MPPTDPSVSTVCLGERGIKGERGCYPLFVSASVRASTAGRHIASVGAVTEIRT